MIKAIIDAVNIVVMKTRKSLRDICRDMDLTYTNVVRWRSRMIQGRAVLLKPGPSKTEPLRLECLNRELQELSHGHKRTRGSAKVYGRYSAGISRRDFSRLLYDVRRESNRLQRQELSHVTWHKVGVTWAMDETEYFINEPDEKMHIQQTIELASNYRFPTICGAYQAVGEEIGGHLESLVSHYGTPLFLKRDNGGNQNHAAVNDVMENHLILPLNSPVYYAPYNGAVEKAQNELKKVIRKKLMYFEEYPEHHFEVYADMAANELNHQKKRLLAGKNSCQIFFDSNNRMTFTKNERRDIYEWILERSAIILDSMDNVNHNNVASTWRIACIMWLQKQNLITISKNQKVLPYFLTQIYHN